MTDASNPQVPDTVREVSPTPTGEPRVDAAIQPLQGIGSAPVDEHVAIYDDVHRRLQDALADLDES